MNDQIPDCLRVPTGAETPEEVRAELVEKVRERLQKGELDSDMALVETALALLDGDQELIANR